MIIIALGDQNVLIYLHFFVNIKYVPRFRGPYYPLSDLSCTVPSQNLYSTSCISCHAYKPIESITCHESIKLSQATQQPVTHIIFARPMGHLLLASDYLPLLNLARSTINQQPTNNQGLSDQGSQAIQTFQACIGVAMMPR